MRHVLWKKRRHVYMGLIDLVFLLVMGGYVLPEWTAWYTLHASSTTITTPVTGCVTRLVTRSMGDVSLTSYDDVATFSFAAPSAGGASVQVTQEILISPATCEQFAGGAPLTLRYALADPTIVRLETAETTTTLVIVTCIILGHWTIHLVVISLAVLERIRSRNEYITGQRAFGPDGR